VAACAAVGTPVGIAAAVGGRTRVVGEVGVAALGVGRAPQPVSPHAAPAADAIKICRMKARRSSLWVILASWLAAKIVLSR
jgi:hypothetical protein